MNMIRKIVSALILISLLSSAKSSSIKQLLDVDNPIFFNPNDQINIDFGFSLSLFFNATHRSLLVGAPLANTSQVGVVSPGALYFCDLLQLKDTVYCTQLVVDKRNAEEKYSSYVSEDAKDFQRLGASLATKENKVLVCAPNWHYFEMRLDSPIDTPVGTCFFSSSLENFEQFSVPYDLYGDQSIDYLRTGSCQSGFSAAMTQSFNSILGSPGCYNWQGDVFAGQPSKWTHFGKNFTEKDFGGEDSTKNVWMSNKYVGYSVTHGIFSNKAGVVAGSPRATNTPKKMSQANGDDLVIVSPMVTIFFESEKWLKLWMNIFPPTNSTGQVDALWIFSYFGYAVAVADVDGNGLDDVIVGAPFYHNQTQKDQGAIVVYLQTLVPGNGIMDSKYEISLESNKILRVGQKDYGRFGSCISPIGDIDGDGLQDIAVGAPYAPGGGQVYIYLGSIEGLPDMPNFVISASDSYLAWKNLKGFGSAIAPGFLVNDGLQTDLAIGSSSSDSVVVFISKEMIAVDWSIKFPEKMDLRSKCVLKKDVVPCTNIVTCLSYSFLQMGKSGDTRPKEFILHYKLDTDASPKRLFFDNERTTKTRNIFLEYENVVYFEDNVYTSRQIENFDPYEIESQITHIPRPQKDKSSLHSSQETKKTDYLDILIQCKADEISSCESEIALQSKVLPMSVDASNVKLNVSYEVTKSGEPAYSLRLKLKTDDYLVISGKPILDEGSISSPVIDCRKLEIGTFECYLGNLVNEFDLLRFHLTLTTTEAFLNASNLRHHADVFKIASSLSSLSTIKDPSAAKTEMFVSITTDPKISLAKDKSTNYVLYNDSAAFVYPEEAGEDVTKLGPVVTHKYTIYNSENYAIENNEITFYHPLKIKDKYLLYRMSLPAVPGMKNILEKCKKRNEKGAFMEEMRTLPLVKDITWFVLTCNISALKPKHKVPVEISSNLVFKTIREDVASLEFDEIYSFMTIKSRPTLFGKEYFLSYTNHIPTEIDYGEHNFNKITWWMILLATLLACLILTLIIFVLCKCNFFARKKVGPPSLEAIPLPSTEEDIESEELQNLKTEEPEDYDNVQQQ